MPRDDSDTGERTVWQTPCSEHYFSLGVANGVETISSSQTSFLAVVVMSRAWTLRNMEERDEAPSTSKYIVTLSRLVQSTHHSQLIRRNSGLVWLLAIAHQVVFGREKSGLLVVQAQLTEKRWQFILAYPQLAQEDGYGWWQKAIVFKYIINVLSSGSRALDSFRAIKDSCLDCISHFQHLSFQCIHRSGNILVHRVTTNSSISCTEGSS